MGRERACIAVAAALRCLYAGRGDLSSGPNDWARPGLKVLQKAGPGGARGAASANSDGGAGEMRAWCSVTGWKSGQLDGWRYRRAPPKGRQPGPALPADHRTTRGPGSCGTGCAAGRRYQRTNATRRAGAGAACRRGPGPRGPDQIKEREADVRQGKAYQTHPPECSWT